MGRNPRLQLLPTPVSSFAHFVREPSREKTQCRITLKASTWISRAMSVTIAVRCSIAALAKTFDIHSNEVHESCLNNLSILGIDLHFIVDLDKKERWKKLRELAVEVVLGDFKKTMCKICEATFANSYTTVRHIEAAHVSLFAYRCDLCGRGFKTQSQKADHHNKVHKRPSNLIP